MKTYSLEEIYEKIINNQKDKDILRKKQEEELIREYIQKNNLIKEYNKEYNKIHISGQNSTNNGYVVSNYIIDFFDKI